MKKILAFGVIGLTGLWIFAVVFLGRTAAINVEAQLVELNRTMASHSIPVSVSKQSYEAGFLSSASRVQVIIEPEDQEPLTVEMDLDIRHGPLISTSRGPRLGAYYIGVTPELTDALHERKAGAPFLSGFAGRDPISGGVLIDFRGGQTFDLDLAPFMYSEDGTSVVLENGIVATFSTDDQFSTLVGSVKVGALSIDRVAEGSNLDIAASTLTLNISEMYAGSMITGEIDYALDHAVIKTNGVEHRIAGLSLRGISGKNDSGIHGTVAVVADTLSSSDESFKSLFAGPPSARLDIAYQGLDERAVRQYADINKRVNQRVYGALLRGEDAAMEALSEQDMRAYVFAMVGLIRQGFKFDYGITLGQGDTSSGFKLAVDWVDDEALIHKKTLREVLGAIQANLNLVIGKAFLSGNEQLMQMPVDMGYAVNTSAGIASDARLDRGRLLLNGRALPYTQILNGAFNQELPWTAW